MGARKPSPPRDRSGTHAPIVVDTTAFDNWPNGVNLRARPLQPGAREADRHHGCRTDAGSPTSASSQNPDPQERGSTISRSPPTIGSVRARSVISRAAVEAYRVLTRIRAKGFSLAVAGAFAEFGERSVL